MKTHRTSIMLAATSLGLAMAVEPIQPLTSHRGSGRRQYGSRMVGFPANINRHTGEPHKHERAIARRVRQMVRTVSA